MAAQGVIVGEERYVFETQWYDQQAELNRYYRITFYPGDSTIEMVSQYRCPLPCPGRVITPPPL
jgi:hypothetical protein